MNKIPHNNRHLSHLVLIFGAVLGVVIVLGTVLSLTTLRQREIDTWRQQLGSMSLSLAKNTSQTIFAAYLALDSVAEHVRAAGAVDAASLQSRMGTKKSHAVLVELMHDFLQLDVVTIVAANGDVINFSRAHPAPPINLADRDYFKAHQSDPHLGDYISAAVPNKGNGKWTFYLSRRLNDPQGRFMGLVLVGLSVDAFTQFFAQLVDSMGREASISLYRDDLNLLARAPQVDAKIGKVNLTGPTHDAVARIKQSGVDGIVLDADSPRFSTGQAIPRLVAVHKAAPYPLYISLIVEEPIYLASWRRSAYMIIGVAAGSLLLLIVGVIALGRTVAEREKAQQALRESEQRYRTLAAGTFEGVAVAEEGRLVDVNDQLAAMLGYTRAELLGRAVADLIPPEEAKRVLANIAAGADSHSEHEALRKDGSRCLVETHGQSLIHDGRSIRLTAIRDVTAQRAMEAALREGEARLQLALDIFQMGLWERDLVTDQCIWNAHMYELLGLPVGNGHAPAHLFYQHVHPDDISALKESLAAAFTHGFDWKGEIRIVRADGAVRWLMSSGRVIRDVGGNAIKTIGVSSDITARRSMEMALRESEEKLRSAFAHAIIGFALVRPDGMVVDANPAYCRLTGYRLEELRGLNVKDLVHPDDQTANMRLINSMLAGHISNYTLENRLLTKDDRTVWVRKSVSLVRDADGKARWGIILVEDATQRREMEGALRAATAEAERANDAKSRFLAAASHDLRQPLSALGIYADALKGQVIESGQPLLAKLDECIASLSELLNDLLDLSKLEAGVVVPRPSEFALNEVLQQLGAIHGPEAQRKGLRLRCAPTVWAVRSDPVLLRRIIGNFIANAIRYTEAGGVLVGCRRHGGKRWVEVWDTGVGIPPDKTSEIFEEFRQLDNGARSCGSGLGLAIVARTAALLGMQIRVHSRPGRGSLFAIEVPEGRYECIEAATLPSPGTYRPLHVALVEDNVGVREALVLGLGQAGHQVTAASSGGELMERLGGQTPDILVSDYRLGEGETGFNVVENVRAALGQAIPAMLITGDTDPRLLRSMAERGIPVLHKPIDLETLQAYLEDLTFPSQANFS